MRLVEVVIALLLGALVLVGVWRGAASVRRQTVELKAMATTRDALRVAGLLLDLDAGGFEGAQRGGGLAVRAWRWWGVPCDPSAPNGSAFLIWKGLRRPDPAKDSVRLLAGDGTARIRALRRSRTSLRCGGAAMEVTWESSPGDPVPVLVRGFERGAYRIDDAVRYRRGAGGAQPLTATVFDPDSVALTVGPTRIDLQVSGWPGRSWPR